MTNNPNRIGILTSVLNAPDPNIKANANHNPKKLSSRKTVKWVDSISEAEKAMNPRNVPRANPKPKPRLNSASNSTLSIQASFDSSITNSPDSQAIQNAINAAINEIENLITDPITVNILFVNDSSVSLGENSTYITTIDYGTYYTMLGQKVTSANDAIAFASLPPPGIPPNPPLPLPQNGELFLTLPLLRLFGGTLSPPLDSTISINVAVCNLTRPPPILLLQ